MLYPVYNEGELREDQSYLCRDLCQRRSVCPEETGGKNAELSPTPGDLEETRGGDGKHPVL